MSRKTAGPGLTTRQGIDFLRLAQTNGIASEREAHSFLGDPKHEAWLLVSHELEGEKRARLTTLLAVQKASGVSNDAMAIDYLRLSRGFLKGRIAELILGPGRRRIAQHRGSFVRTSGPVHPIAQLVELAIIFEAAKVDRAEATRQVVLLPDWFPVNDALILAAAGNEATIPEAAVETARVKSGLDPLAAAAFYASLSLSITGRETAPGQILAMRAQPGRRASGMRVTKRRESRRLPKKARPAKTRRSRPAVKPVGTSKRARAEAKILALTETKTLQAAIRQLMATHVTITRVVTWLRRKKVDYSAFSLQVMVSRVCRKQGIPVRRGGGRRRGSGPGSPKAPKPRTSWRQRLWAVAAKNGVPAGDEPALGRMIKQVYEGRGHNEGKLLAALNAQAAAAGVEGFQADEIPQVVKLAQ